MKIKVNEEEYTSDNWYGYTGNINYRNNQEAETGKNRPYHRHSQDNPEIRCIQGSGTCHHRRGTAFRSCPQGEIQGEFFGRGCADALRYAYPPNTEYGNERHT